MAYYIDHKKRYPFLDRIIHWIGHLLFVALMFVMAYLMEFFFILYALPDLAADLWMTYSWHWMISRGMLAFPACASVVALIHPKAFRFLNPNGIASAMND